MLKVFVISGLTADADYSAELEAGAKILSNSGIFDVSHHSFAELGLDKVGQKDLHLVVTDGLDEATYDLLQRLSVPVLTFGNLEKYRPASDLVIDYKSTQHELDLTGPRHSLRQSTDFDLVELAKLIYIPVWDSDFFGFPVAYVTSNYLTPSIANRVNNFAEKNNVRLIQYLCNCHDNASVLIAEKNGFHFTDIRFTLDLNLERSKTTAPALEGNWSFGKATSDHISALRNLASKQYLNSRFYFDGNFDPEKVHEYYMLWIEKAVNGTFDNVCYCLFDGTAPAAFCSVRYVNDQIAAIGLVGVDANKTGQGLGKKLMSLVIDQVRTDGFNEFKVVTQGRNYFAQRLYQAVGFKTRSTELWYHKWL